MFRLIPLCSFLGARKSGRLGGRGLHNPGLSEVAKPLRGMSRRGCFASEGNIKRLIRGALRYRRGWLDAGASRVRLSRIALADRLRIGQGFFVPGRVEGGCAGRVHLRRHSNVHMEGRSMKSSRSVADARARAGRVFTMRVPAAHGPVLQPGREGRGLLLAVASGQHGRHGSAWLVSSSGFFFATGPPNMSEKRPRMPQERFSRGVSTQKPTEQKSRP